MTATIVAQQAINGIVLGSLYVLVALGLYIIAKSGVMALIG